MALPPVSPYRELPRTSLEGKPSGDPSQPPPTQVEGPDLTPYPLGHRKVEVKEEFEYEHYKHTWTNKAPLYKKADNLTSSPKFTKGMSCNWSYQKEQSEVNLRSRIKSSIVTYIELSSSKREQYLQSRMLSRKYEGDDFPDLKGEDEAYAAKKIERFEILGHYAGEVHNNESLKALAARYGYKIISKYLVSTQDGFCISGLKEGNVCSLINACTLHVATLDKSNPIVTKLPDHSLKANVAFLPIRYKGQVATMLISTTDIKEGQSLWLDYGSAYWKDVFQVIEIESEKDEEDELKPPAPKKAKADKTVSSQDRPSSSSAIDLYCDKSIETVEDIGGVEDVESDNEQIAPHPIERLEECFPELTPEELKKSIARYCSPASSLNPYRMLLGLTRGNPRKLPDVLLLVDYIRRHKLLGQYRFLQLTKRIQLSDLVLRWFERRPPNLPLLLQKLTLADIPTPKGERRAWQPGDLLEATPALTTILQSRRHETIHQMAVRVYQQDVISAVWLKLLSLYEVGLFDELNEAAGAVHQLCDTFQTKLMQLRASLPKLDNDPPSECFPFDETRLINETLNFHIKQPDQPQPPAIVAEYRDNNKHLKKQYGDGSNYLDNDIPDEKLIEKILQNTKSREAALTTLIYQKLYVNTVTEQGINGLVYHLKRAAVYSQEQSEQWKRNFPTTWEMYTLIKKHITLPRFQIIGFLALGDIGKAAAHWPDTFRDLVLGWHARSGDTQGLLREMKKAENDNQAIEWQEHDIHLLVPELSTFHTIKADKIVTDFLHLDISLRTKQCPKQITALARQGHEKAIYAFFYHHMLKAPFPVIKRRARMCNIPPPPWLLAIDKTPEWTDAKVTAFLKRHWTEPDTQLVSSTYTLKDAARRVGFNVDARPPAN